MNCVSIDRYLGERIAAGDFPSAVYLVAGKGDVVLRGALGNAVIEPEILPAWINTIYDTASLTKVLVTGLVIAILIENGEISLEDAAADYLPELGVDDKSAMTIGQLVTHTSGLPAWQPLYLLASTAETVLDVISRTPLAPGRTDAVYSDLNFIVLGKIIERVTGTSLDEAFEEMVTD